MPRIATVWGGGAPWKGPGVPIVWVCKPIESICVVHDSMSIIHLDRYLWLYMQGDSGSDTTSTHIV